MMKRIYIRVDGNEIIATGHVMRCLSIAEQIRKLGAEVMFVTADEKPCPLITDRGFPVDVLDTVWNDLDGETERICHYVREHQVKLLLVDSYYVTKEYLQNLSQYTKIAYIDDLRKFLYPVQALIHYWAFADADGYRKPYEQEGRRIDFLIGGSFIPLREEFALKPFSVRPKVKKVLVTTGGTDRLDVAGNLLRAVMKNDELMKREYHIIAGCFNRNKEKLYRMAENNPNFYIHENVADMSYWMRSCDVAVSAAGTTTYELCACGIPSVCLEIADNQEGAVFWEEKGYMLYAGNACRDMDSCVKRCVEALLAYCKSEEMRRDKSVRMQSLVDGYGAQRIAKYLLDGGLENAE
ncbi:MAG: UDP-2,4-diacetamido-2,4,6-trideoxy-beta-L-altropyranose hydrolase [Bacteroidales bacterium]|nr:UDP-2,4-diacetamido-2,4,6-trideoxy-beta-L-altropyranose hydrolase [Clostridium sp.]MCM1204381.1 UDP-2,4-diacetamido-2,4,6-trideoxy-beta-L-altropyranose hydrolase [Bacteroidales bacterium]